MINKKVDKKAGALPLIIGITIIIFSLYVFFTFFNQAKIQNALTGGGRGNMLYVQLVNYTMPIVKTTSFDESDMAESTFSLKSGILNYIGVNLNKPDEFLKREISYLKLANDYVANNNLNDNSINVSDFQLKDSDITKNTGDSNPNNNSSPNVPDGGYQVYNPKLKKTLDNSNPQILIYHTHTTESYGDFGQDNFDPAKNVCAVGAELAKTLSNDYGISVIHDTTVHNATAYNSSYIRSRETLNKYLNKYGDFKMIIDIHRDSTKNKNLVTENINGQNLGKFWFVMAKNNPHFDKNMLIVNSLLNTAKKDFPQLVINDGLLPYNHANGVFNQDKSNNAILIEIGAVSNTLDEAKGTSKYVARMIAEYLNK